MTQTKLILGAVIFSTLLTGCSTTPKIKPFDSSSSLAMIVVEEKDGLQGGIMTFTPVDLQSKTSSGNSVSISKREDNRLRTSNKSLQTKGDGLLIAQNMSRFSPETVNPGFYAITGFSFATGLGVSGGCPKGFTNVYEVKAGQINVINSDTLTDGSSSNILTYGSGLQVSTKADLEEILSEYPTINAKVVTAPVVANISFVDEKGMTTGCRQDTFKVNQANQ